jgi:hypothetical protein
VDPRNPILPHVPFLHDLASKWYHMARPLLCVVSCAACVCVLCIDSSWCLVWSITTRT